MNTLRLPSFWRGMSFTAKAGYLCGTRQARDYSDACSILGQDAPPKGAQAAAGAGAVAVCGLNFMKPDTRPMNYQLEIEARFPKAKATTLFVHACGEVDQLRAQSAHHSAQLQQLGGRVKDLEGVLQAIADEANSHHEYNPVGKVSRLPIGYTKILSMAAEAIEGPDAEAEALRPVQEQATKQP